MPSAPAEAHVKWFCAYDVAGSPNGLENVLCSDFEVLTGFALLMLVFGCMVEVTPVGTAMLRALDRTTWLLRRGTEHVIRITAGAFFACLGSMLHVLLTPELATGLHAVAWLQLAIAASMLSRRTLPFGAAGIVALFGLAVSEYGVFHMMDYPVFLGLAAYLACVGLRWTPAGVRPLDLLRWAAALTLMWASIEKWAYPDWTTPLFALHPQMNMGFDIDFYMRAAGVVEFTLAFCLIWTPLVRRIAALILTGIFVAAIKEFGLVDAIGHSCIIAVLLVIAADDRRAGIRLPWTAWRPAAWVRIACAPAAYAAALALFLFGYYGAHATIYADQSGSAGWTVTVSRILG